MAKLRARAQLRHANKLAEPAAPAAPLASKSKEPMVEKRTMENMLPHVDDERLAASAGALRQHIRASKVPLPPAVLLELAALYQQATEGDAPPVAAEGISRQDAARWRCWDAKRGELVLSLLSTSLVITPSANERSPRTCRREPDGRAPLVRRAGGAGVNSSHAVP